MSHTTMPLLEYLRTGAVPDAPLTNEYIHTIQASRVQHPSRNVCEYLEVTLTDTSSYEYGKNEEEDEDEDFPIEGLCYQARDSVDMVREQISWAAEEVASKRRRFRRGLRSWFFGLWYTV
jgi:hypothetical protein